MNKHHFAWGIIGTGNIAHKFAGCSADAWFYEVQDFERYVSQKSDDGQLARSIAIMQQMDQLRATWGHVYPGEEGE